MSRCRLLLVSFLLGWAGLAAAQNGTVALDAFPTMTVADGRSTVTISAQVRDSSGNLVPDGTQVVFDSKLGVFRERVVATRNGFARAILVAGSVPGSERVRVSALRFSAAGELDVEFVANRSMLTSARDFIEVVGSETLWYSVQDRVLEATGANRGGRVKFRGIEIEADDLQVQVQTSEVRAKRAVLRMGRTEQHFEQLYFQLSRRAGFGLGEIEEVVLPEAAVSTGPDPDDGGLGSLLGAEWPGGDSVPVTRRFFGLISIDGRGVRRAEQGVDTRLLRFQQISESVSMIRAEKAVAYPRREVQFHRADVQMAQQSLMRVPLFRVNVNDSSPLITEQWVNVSNNNFALNYPYYLSLKPGETSLLRLRYGLGYGTGTGASEGTFLDYELGWNRGANFEGALNVTGIGRNDWGLALRQTWSHQDSTVLSAQLDFPAHRAMYGSMNLSRQFPGFSTNVNANYGRSLRGLAFQSEGATFVVEKDPVKMGVLPARLYFGVTASQSRVSAGGFSRAQESAGAQARLVSEPLQLAPNHRLSLSYTLAQLSGQNVRNGISQIGTANLSSQIFPGFGLNTTYEFLDDGFSSEFLGRHKLSFEGLLRTGDLSFSGFWSRSLDIDRQNASARMRYRMGPLWRFSYSYFFDQFGPDSFMDQSVILSYKLGYREVGLSYSRRTRRLGLEILGTSID